MPSIRVKRDGPGWAVWLDGRKSVHGRFYERRTALATARAMRAQYRVNQREARR